MLIKNLHIYDKIKCYVVIDAFVTIFIIIIKNKLLDMLALLLLFLLLLLFGLHLLYSMIVALRTAKVIKK